MGKVKRKQARHAWIRFGDIGRAALIGVTLLPTRSKPERTAEAAVRLAAIKLIVEALKLAVPERRPDGDNRKSFPSEHAAQSVAAAMIIEREHPGLPGVAAAALATAVALSRIEGRRHYPRDVLAGAAIGAAIIWGSRKLGALFPSRLADGHTVNA